MTNSSRIAKASLSVTSKNDPQTVMRTVMADPLPAMFTGYGPFPAVTATDQQVGEIGSLGMHRRVVMKDGGTILETLATYETGRVFSYHLTDFTNLFQYLLTRIEDTWEFEPVAAGTAVQWNTIFHAKPGYGLLVKLVIAPLWGRYMKQMLHESGERLQLVA